MRNIHINELINIPLSQSPEKIAIVDENNSYSYATLEKKSQSLAAFFQQENMQHERIAILLPNSFELMTVYLACFKTSAILVPLEFRDAPAEAMHVYQDATPKWLIIHKDKLADLKLIDLNKTSIKRIFVLSKQKQSEYEDFYSLYETNPALFKEQSFTPNTYSFLLYTSGSTGLPKGVIYSYGSTAAMINSVLDALPAIKQDSTFVIHDSNSHIDGLLEILPELYVGGSVVLRKEFAVDKFYQDLRQYRPQIIGAHIDHLWQIIRYPTLQRNDFTSVQQIFTGGDELPLELQKECMDKTGKFVQVGYGMTESIWLTITHEPYVNQLGAMGKPVNDDIKIRLVDKVGHDVEQGEIGEIWINAPMNTPGYWNNPAATQAAFADSWLKTGDSAKQDKDGNYWYVGRLKQIIERNSENITPYEIEEAIYRNPAVASVGVIGVPDPKEDQVPIAFVVLKPNQQLTETDLIKFLHDQIAVYKIPAAIYFLKTLPLTASNKLNREALKAEYEKLKSHKEGAT